MPEVFNNRKKQYISQTVPASAGTALRFSVILHNDCHCNGCWMFVCLDGQAEQCIQMTPSDRFDEQFETYTCTFTPEQSGLYWYRFEFEGNGRRHKIFRTPSGAGDIVDHGMSWQLTVYDAHFTTPDTFKTGTIYQIFPDRFAKSDQPKYNIPHDRYLVNDWSAQPAWRQNGGSNSLCNDYFGGDLKGIEQKLPYLKSLGITILYLNPIFEAHSNHRYNTADYMRIDPSLGTEEDFISLCNAAHKLGMKVILDGVFSHTGADSVYFNMYGRYKTPGAFNSLSSPYYPWFKFVVWPSHYQAWWGVPSLPEVMEDTPSFVDFICGENGVLRHWMRKGADGWRLDVADELPDFFLDRVRAAIKAENPDALLMGEVWEDASNKISHGGRRRFVMGKQLDSVMNYPFRSAIIDFVMGGNADRLDNTVHEILCNYPPQVVDVTMNHIGTHDTERILSVLGGLDLDTTREQHASMKLSEEQTKLGLQRLRLAAALQYTLPGIPSLYYGDEAQVEGMRDPFNRTTYPWGHENKDLISYYQKLGALRLKNAAFTGGQYQTVEVGLGYLLFTRQKGDSEVLIAVNRWTEPETVTLPDGYRTAYIGADAVDGKAILAPMSASIFIKE